MPSLHMAWAGWCTLALWRTSERRWLRALALLYPCLTAFAVLATGNHFLLDIFGGLLALALSVLARGLAAAARRASHARAVAPARASAPVAGRSRQSGVAHVTKLLRSPRQVD